MRGNEKEGIVVVKYGSASVANDTGMDYDRLTHHARQLAKLNERYRVVVVSSGSVAVGRALWGDVEAEPKPTLRTLATMGSGRAFTAWEQVLINQGIKAGQVLVTHHELEDRQEGSMLQSLIEENLGSGVMSVINENDALSDTELAQLKFGGDNDGLAAHVAMKTRAGHLCLMTEREGLIDRKGKIVEQVNSSNFDWAMSLTDKTVDNGRRGGMPSKLRAGMIAAKNGVQAHIAHSMSAPLLDVINGNRGTHFPVK